LNGGNHYIEGSVHTNKNLIANGSKLTITGECEAASTITTNGSEISIGTKVPGASNIEMPDFSEIIKQQAEETGTVYTGNKTFNGSFTEVESSLYVTGNVYVNGSNFRGKGCILATGDIIFNGSSLMESTDDSVCFYSKNGNIIVNGSNASLEGILYAPEGSVIMNGSNQTVDGRVIANTITINGSNLEVTGSPQQLKSLPSSGAVKLIR
jgi:formylmethanofuran dehydrogenase subunit C